MSKYSLIAMNKIKNLRIEKGLSQVDMAKLLNTTYQAYAHYERGRREPDIETIIKLSQFFNISLNELFDL